MPVVKPVSEKLTLGRLMNSRNMSQADLARASGLVESQISRILSRETRDVKLQSIAVPIARGFKLPVHEVFPEFFEPPEHTRDYRAA